MTDKRNPDFARNRLAEATSPYLLQHKDNPVHWQPWEPAVFDEARRRNLPVLLSIGYAACHWCHVMAHESFEDPQVAALMNDHFICIKLDREERPDLDEIYMAALSMMGEQGGWPLTICLDADGAPFWGGTYFPKTPQYGRPGFIQVLTEIARVWRDTPEKIQANSRALMTSLKARAAADARADMPADLPRQAATGLAAHIDLDKGGLTGAPKFPQPFLYRFIWQQAQLTGDRAMAEAVLTTARKICQGGIYDHLGGGFARYSVDADWLVPHFEKMLYDNALLVELLATLYRHDKDPLFAARIEETIDWLARDMRTDDGAFAASLDADTDGEEGRFYVWSKAEIAACLGDDADGFCRSYGVTEDGNFEGRNILHLLASGDVPQPDWATARDMLLAQRHARTRPGRDDKILADWTGMTIAALADAAGIFARRDWLALAENAYRAAQAALTDEQGNLCHAARNARRLKLTLCQDLAFFGRAAAALYEATGQTSYLAQAETYAEQLHDGFHDTARGGYLSNRRSGSDAPVNHRDTHDNAQPSANAAAIDLFARLFALTGDMKWQALGHDAFAALSGHLAKNYPSMTALLSAQQALSDPLAIVIIGDDEAATALAATARTHRIAQRSIVCLAPDTALAAGHPAYGKTLQDGRATAYICRGQSCLPPITEPAALGQKLDALSRARQTVST
jgi:uncharacterized protein